MAFTRTMLIALCMLAGTVIGATPIVRAQSIFRVTFDTVTANAGDTVAVNARYTFTPSGAHDIQNYAVQFAYDSTEVHLLGYDFDSTATPASDTNLAGTSRHGIAAIGNSEIDLTNSVLFTIRFRVDKRLADTAFVTWNTDVPMFSEGEGVDSVTMTNGWVRTPSAAGHVIVETPGDTIRGISNGYSPDSVKFAVPFAVSNLAGANMTEALLTFTYDTTMLSLMSVVPNPSENLSVDSVVQTGLGEGLNEAQIALSKVSGLIHGNDTLVTLMFAALIAPDTESTAFSNATLRATNPTGFIGNTDYRFDSIYFEGAFPGSQVVRSAEGISPMQVYPNPASNEVTIVLPSGNESPRSTIEVFDALGRTVWNGLLNSAAWEIPSGISSGMYRIEIDRSGERYSAPLLIEPR